MTPWPLGPPKPRAPERSKVSLVFCDNTHVPGLSRVEAVPPLPPAVGPLKDLADEGSAKA